ncbi:YbaK / prolyl-tRNA synthetases associated domain protein [Roseovarius tolerans]|uniref:YbaK / prolyl-tRNA synthetases associated domain protein n=1 Tax=Roseovarius tolerans TaxID=74031 RepID=A0A0L6CTE8_9RHOB|nr:YbaK/EbsC family protein [Roseovarius tolerans]KNX40793.1 YbaK / prolyl-tRNA synthetases associated domain protein [Roseovarius tolerans]
MSKSLARVTRALQEAGLEIAPIEIGNATTAQMAADLVGCDIAQIAKSIMFRGQQSGTAILFVTSGANRVDDARASAVAGETLGKADAALIRAQTGFAIGGVSPVGHLTRPRAFFDPYLLTFAEVWAAAGTPRHLFGIAPRRLMEMAGAQEAGFTA